MDRPPRIRRRAVPLGFAVLLQTLGAVAVAVRFDVGAGVAYGLLGWATAATVLLGRPWPGPAAVVAAALEGAALLILPLPPLALFPVAIALVAAVAAGARWWAGGAAAGLLALLYGQLLLDWSPVVAVRALLATVVLLLALGAGGFARARRVRWREEAERQEDRRRIAVGEERVRIARELHDVLAHSLSSISVQAGVGLHLAADRPAAATEALAVIRDASRDALDEVRGVLGILRDDAPRVPEPDLDALPALIAPLVAQGARIELDDGLHPRPALPVQLAMYRVVQEALTNARRHAPGAAVRVRLAGDGATATASVRDVLPGAAPVPPVAGNGITGMRERAAQLGGRLDLHVHEDGLEVVAVLPVRP